MNILRGLFDCRVKKNNAGNNVTHTNIHLERNAKCDKFPEKQLQEDKLRGRLFWEASRIHGFK